MNKKILMDANLYMESIVQAEIDFGNRPGESHS